MNKEQALFNMVEKQIRPSGIYNSKVLSTFEKVKREIFVPHHLRKLAFSDLAIPLPNGQHMLPPIIDAHILQGVNPKSEETVLEIGTGSGYMAALLANLSKTVDTIEIDPLLLAYAEKNIRNAKISNITMRLGDSLHKTPNNVNYDVIIFSGALKKIPYYALKHLKVNGRLIVFVGIDTVMQAKLITCINANKYQYNNLFETTVPYLKDVNEK